MVIKSISSVFHLRKRPSSYRAHDAAYSTGGKKGFYLASYPRPYPLTPQQRRVADAANACGIRKGMSKRDLQTAMVECIKPKLRRGG